MSPEIREKFKSIRKLIKGQDFINAFLRLCEIARPDDDFSVQHRIAKMFHSIPKEQLDLKPIKIAIVSTSTVDHFAEVFQFWLAKDGFDTELYLAEYNTMYQTVLDPSSKLYMFEPEIVWLFSSFRDVKVDIPPGSSPEKVKDSVQSAVAGFTSLWETIKSHSAAYIIQNNADLPLNRAFGNYEGTICWGQYNVLREFNLALSRSVTTGVTIFDLDFISSFFGKKLWFDERYWYHSKHSFSLDAVGLVAFKAARLILAIKGLAKKCLVLDLDNILWGGVIGDDGLEGIRLGNGAEGEAFVDFQKYLLRLKNRGIILTVCSKNNEENAKLPFLKHPDMRLKLDDIAVFAANWDNKADNIRTIAEVLDIGLDSLVFIDDNPVERAFVHQTLPMVSVPEMPEDPTLYIRVLDEQNFFETITFSEEDKARSDMYRGNAQRKGIQKKFTNLSDFLKDLSMETFIGEFDDLHLPRISQLINKSNQFHLTTTRYTEAQIRMMAGDDNIVCRYFKMRDRFGDNGLVAVIILKRDNIDLVIDTWVMSCRVLSRSMEEFIHNEIIAIARKLNCERLLGSYIPTKKNKLVADLYKRLGYSMVDKREEITCWELPINEYTPMKETYIDCLEAY